MSYHADQDQCDCGSFEFVCVTCPETMKYIDVCKKCGDAGSHLCDHVDCPCNEHLKEDK